MRISAASRGVFVVLLATALSSCGPANEYQPPPPPTVSVAQPVVRELPELLEFTGRTDAVQQADIYARVSGYLQEVHFTAGQTVEEGALLFTIDPAPYEAALNAAKADLASGEADVRLSTAKLDAVKKAHGQSAATDLELWTAEAERDLAAAHVAAAKASIQDAELKLSWTQVRAPFAGRVMRQLVDPGNLVGDGERTLLTHMVRIDPMYVYFQIDERRLVEFRRREGKITQRSMEDRPDVMLMLADGRAFSELGKPDYADSIVNPRTGTVEVRAVFNNPDEVLLPGLFARTRVIGDAAERLVVPEHAIQRDVVGAFVLVVEDGKAARRDVELGQLYGFARIIAGGLEADEQVIVQGMLRARVGAEVNPEPLDVTKHIDAALQKVFTLSSKPDEDSAPGQTQDAASTTTPEAGE